MGATGNRIPWTSCRAPKPVRLAPPSKEPWTKAAAYLARLVPHEAIALAKAAGIPSPNADPPPIDVRAIEEAIVRAADLLDVSLRRVRAAVRELVQASLEARGALAELGKAAEEKVVDEGRAMAGLGRG